MSEEIKEVSYCVGMSLGGSLLQQNLSNLDVDAMSKAIKDTFEGTALKFTPEEANGIIQNFLKAESEKAFGEY